MAELIVCRRFALWRDVARAYRVLVDGAECGTVAHRGELRIPITPGHHRVQVKIDWCASAPLDVDVAAGVEQVLDCGPNGNPLLVILYITVWKSKYLWLRKGAQYAVQGTHVTAQAVRVAV